MTELDDDHTKCHEFMKECMDEIKLLKNEGNCERCQGMTREQLCNELGDYRVAMGMIIAWFDGEMPERMLIEVVKQSIETLEEALAERNATDKESSVNGTG